MPSRAPDLRVEPNRFREGVAASGMAGAAPGRRLSRERLGHSQISGNFQVEIVWGRLQGGDGQAGGGYVLH